MVSRLYTRLQHLPINKAIPFCMPQSGIVVMLIACARAAFLVLAVYWDWAVWTIATCIIDVMGGWGGGWM